MKNIRVNLSLAIALMGASTYCSLAWAVTLNGIGGTWSSIGTGGGTDHYGNTLLDYQEDMHFMVRDLSIGATAAAATSETFLAIGYHFQAADGTICRQTCRYDASYAHPSEPFFEVAGIKFAKTSVCELPVPRECEDYASDWSGDEPNAELLGMVLANDDIHPPTPTDRPMRGPDGTVWPAYAAGLGIALAELGPGEPACKTAVGLCGAQVVGLFGVMKLTYDTMMDFRQNGVKETLRDALTAWSKWRDAGLAVIAVLTPFMSGTYGVCATGLDVCIGAQIADQALCDDGAVFSCIDAMADQGGEGLCTAGIGASGILVIGTLLAPLLIFGAP